MDEFGNILLDSLDIVETIYPFYQFQVKDTYPVLKAILPYGWDGKKFVSQGAQMQKTFEAENALIKREYEERKQMIIEASTKKNTEEKRAEIGKDEGSFGHKIFYFLKRTGRMLYMITIIAAYWAVFVPRARIQDNLK